MSREVYTFDDIRVECETFRLYRKGERVSITPRSFDVLVFLIRNRGRAVEKQEIFDSVWKGSFVTDNSLAKAIKEIRRATGDSADEPRHIETVPKHGYMFVADLGGAGYVAIEETKSQGAPGAGTVIWQSGVVRGRYFRILAFITAIIAFLLLAFAVLSWL
jgi:DNA-binding winged helix-turn-helix (wHTH) protein